MTNPNHNPARLIIAGAMYWNEATQTMFRPVHTAEVIMVEGYVFKPYPWGEDADDITVEDMYAEDGGDAYYYDGSGTTMVSAELLVLTTPIENLKDLL